MEADGGGMVAAFLAWAASERVSAAASARSRVRSLSVQAASSATFVGLLVGLAESRTPAVVSVGGRRLSGVLTGVGRDFLVMEQRERLGVTVVAAAKVSSVSASDGRVPEERPAPIPYGLTTLLAYLAEERSPVSVHTPDEAVEGDLVAVGEDVISLTTGASRRLIHLPVPAVCWLEVR